MSKISRERFLKLSFLVNASLVFGLYGCNYSEDNKKDEVNIDTTSYPELVVPADGEIREVIGVVQYQDKNINLEKLYILNHPDLAAVGFACVFSKKVKYGSSTIIERIDARQIMGFQKLKIFFLMTQNLLLSQLSE